MKMLAQVVAWYVVSVLSVNGWPLPEARTSAELAASSDPLRQRADEHQCALSTIAYVAELIPSIPQVAHQVMHYSLIGEILWQHDQDRARHYFRHAFATIDKLTVDNPATVGDRQARVQQEREQKHQLRLEVLRRVAPLDRQLERELLQQLRTSQGDGMAELDEHDASELIELATVLLDYDPDQAVHLATASLDHGVPADFGAFLHQLRQSDPDSANQLFGEALRTASENQQTDVDTLLSLLEFAFPPSGDDHVSPASTVNPEQTTQLLDVLASRLTQGESSEDIVHDRQRRLPSSSSNHAAIVRHSISLFERYAPEHVPALEQVSHAGSTQSVAQRSTSSDETASHHRSVERFTNPSDQVLALRQGRADDRQLARAAISAAHHADAEKARQMLAHIRDRTIHQHAADLVNAELALHAIAADDFTRVRHYVGQISQLKQRVTAALLATQKLASQGQTDAALFWLDEMYQQVVQSGESAELWQIVFPLVSAAMRLDSPRVFEMAQFAVTALNRADSRIWHSRTDGAGQASLQQYVMDTFEALARVDMDRALYLAMQLKAIELRTLAQLAICRRVLVGN